MGIYHTTGVTPLVPVSWKVCQRDGNRPPKDAQRAVDGNFPLVPDGFLSLGVKRRKAERLGFAHASLSRLSYVVWEEQEIVPKFVLEVVSKTPGNEYESKLQTYANLGVLYYLIYNPQYWQRDQHQPFELYKLIGKEYHLQIGEPFWMAEINLGIGRSNYIFSTIQREVLFWYDQNNTRYLTSSEVAQIERQQRELAEQQIEFERQQREKLAAKLRELGIDPNQI